MKENNINQKNKIKMRKIANFFVAQTSATPIVGQCANSKMSGVVLWTEELQKQLEEGTLSSKYAGIHAVDFVFGLRYCLLSEGDSLYIPSTNTFAKAVRPKSNSEYIVMIDGVEQTILRKDIFKVISRNISEKQLKPVLSGSLRHYNKIVVDFPDIKTEVNENFTVSVLVDGNVMETVKVTGDKEVDKLNVASACNKYAEPNLDENDYLLIGKYKKPKVKKEEVPAA